jgi:alkylation response protein AidB-like acyl-CoA dehydrogenase
VFIAGPESVVEIRFSPAEEAFRAEASRLARGETCRGRRARPIFRARADYDLGWQRRMHDAGWAGIAWPRAYGGRGRDAHGAAHLVRGVRARRRAGRSDALRRLNHAGPTLIAAAARSRRRTTCRASSAATSSGARASPSRTPAPTWRACRRAPSIDGDHLVVTGQKIWTSFAHIAEFQELLVRTDPERRATAHHVGHLPDGRAGHRDPADHDAHRRQRLLPRCSTTACASRSRTSSGS